MLNQKSRYFMNFGGYFFQKTIDIRRKMYYLIIEQLFNLLIKAGVAVWEAATGLRVIVRLSTKK